MLLLCLCLLIFCALCLCVLIFRKKEEKDGGSYETNGKIDKLYASSDYTQKSISQLGAMTEYRLNNIQKNLTEQLQYITENNRRNLDEIRRTVDDKLSQTLESKLTESYSVIQARLEAVARGIGEVHSLASSVADIKKVFSNVKLRGTWGEAQLNTLLSQMLAPNQFAHSVKLNPLSDSMVDFAVLLPSEDGATTYLPIDSKFPIEEYRRLIDAQNLCNREAEEKAVKNLARAVKLQADSIAEKYILPPKTTDFAVMYLPLESLYAEVLNLPDINDYLSLKKILVCGPTNLSALLSTLQTGFKVAAIEKQSQELWNLLSVFKHEFGKFTDILDKTQKKLQEAQETIESAAGRTKIIAKKLKSVDVGSPNEITSGDFHFPSDNQ